MTIHIRPITPADAPACGKIVYEAFANLARRHGFPPDFPDAEVGTGLISLLANHHGVYGVVAEDERGRILGSNFIDERNAIRGVGPITVDPAAQARGIGRRLMQAVLERAHDSAGVRLLQDGYNVKTMSLYTALGFDIKEPIVLMAGRTSSAPPQNHGVRPLREGDLDGCAALYRRVCGFDRSAEVREAIPALAPFVAVRNNAIVAYTTSPVHAMQGHGVAEDEDAMRTLLLGAAGWLRTPLSILIPTRWASFYRWALAEGLRAVKPMNLMALGEYQEPRGCWFPSILY
ncbi:MAG: GNAT family N-acetyltransferase [Candidatus Binataceae bacterium]